MSKHPSKKTRPDGGGKADPAVRDKDAAETTTPSGLGHQEAHTEAADQLAAGVEDQQTETDPVDTLRSELDQTRNHLLRSRAELENYRKRVARQTQEERRYAQMPLMRDLLHVWDNMGRAIEAAAGADHTEGLLEGFKMVIQELEDVLDRHHCTKIDADGKPFDPHLHEAILQQPSEDHPPGTVAQVARVGFRLHDRVVRPSQVIVSAAAPEPGQQDESEKD